MARKAAKFWQQHKATQGWPGPTATAIPTLSKRSGQPGMHLLYTHIQVPTIQPDQWDRHKY